MGEYPLIVLRHNMKDLVDQVSRQSKHCFAGQRTNLKSLPVVLERVHNAVDHFLKEIHAPSVNFGSNQAEVKDGSRFDEFAEQRFTPRTECVTWRLR